jgi:hypothetical protein
VIGTLSVTVLIESAVVAAFAIWRRKPIISLLVSSFLANLLTQSLLWIALTIFPQHYIAALIIGEFSIWGLEAIILYLYRFNQLDLKEAILLSLIMNLASFGIGWLLPV